jgi:general secretion pathway protein M
MKDWYFGLEPRERLVVTAGAVVVTLLLFWGLVLSPIYGASAATAQRVDEKRATLAFLRTAAAELAGAPALAAQGPDMSGQSLVVVVDRSARSAGLGGALTRNQPVGEDGIRVRLENAAFDALATWLGTLNSSAGLTIETASFERAPDDGRVNATLTLRLGQP